MQVDHPGRRRPNPDIGAGDESVRRNTEVGFPEFDHNQWTFEGEIERLGAFSSGASRARGWKRAVGLLLVVTMLAPIALAVVVWFIQLL